MHTSLFGALHFNFPSFGINRDSNKANPLLHEGPLAIHVPTRPVLYIYIKTKQTLKYDQHFNNHI